METLLNILPLIQITLAVILTGTILLQQRGAGLGGAFGGADGGVHYERRGFERTLFKVTIAISVLFVVSVMISVLNGNSSDFESVTTTTDDSVPVLTPDVTVETGSGENIEIIPIDINETDIINTATPEENATL